MNHNSNNITPLCSYGIVELVDNRKEALTPPSSNSWIFDSILMVQRNSTKIYVVFYGKTPGFYYSLWDYRAHIDDDIKLFYKVFMSRNKAESSWMRYWARESLKGPCVVGLDHPFMPLMCGRRLVRPSLSEFKRWTIY